MAADLYLRAREAFRSSLRESPLLAERQLKILCLALGGMKQPQQLLALNYFLALGARPDVVINLDGFNEIALPLAENVPVGLALSHPRSWHLYSHQMVDDRSVSILARMAEERRRIEDRRSLFSAAPIRSSSLFLIVWHIVHARSQSRMLALEESLSEMGRRTGSSRGETTPVRAEHEVLAESVELWKRSSLQMWKTSDANGSTYLHVLQPNQYVPGSKPLTPRERSQAVAPPASRYRRAAERGYPLLIAAGEELREKGVPFVDLTRVFASESETIYVDSCCHYNQRGNELLAAKIGRLVRESIGAKPVENDPARPTRVGPDQTLDEL